MGRIKFTAAADLLRSRRPIGDKNPKRRGDAAAGSHSPMKCVNPPVGWMFLEGAARLKNAGLHIPGLHQGDLDRVAIEAYPGYTARQILGTKSYKSDKLKVLDSAREAARHRLLEALETDGAGVGVQLALSAEAREKALIEPGGDSLDSAICALQAAWSLQRKDLGFGIPLDCDPVEGWIATVPASEDQSRASHHRRSADNHGMLNAWGMSSSGNCYKVKLALAQLGVPHRWNEVDTTKGETRTAAYLAMNPNGQVPLLQLEDGAFLPESNAILWYLAEGTALAPADRAARAQALRWMFFEQYSHEPYVAVARFILYYLPPDSPRRAELPRLQERGRHALGVMEAHLARRDWFAGDRYSVADIALYAYTHCAGDGGLSLDAFPAVRAWLARVRTQPGHIPLG